MGKFSEKPEQLIRSFDELTINKIRDSFGQLNSTTLNEDGIELFKEPFSHCILSDLVTDLEFIDELRSECNSQLKYIQKNNDLYKFQQTKDLGKTKSKSIKKFRDQILYNSIRKLVESLTGIELSTKTDFTSSKYRHTDYLLCHDDDIHDDKTDHGRRIAYIYYLVPDDWTETDGGYLDLFKVNDKLQPTEVVKSVRPKFNSLLFFEVSDRSFHQVAEVLSESKCRLSINGWFHGKINKRPLRHVDQIPEPMTFKDIDPDIFFDWVVEKYLKPDNQTQIQLKFLSSSEIKLQKVFQSKKYEQISESLSSETIVWSRVGPSNRRNYEVASTDSLPLIVQELIQVLTSEFMGLSLSNMTGLALHWSIKKSKEEEIDFDNLSEGSITDDDDDDDNDDNEAEDNGSSASDDLDIPSEEEEQENPNLVFELAKRKNKYPESTIDSKHQKIDDTRPGTSASKNNDSGVEEDNGEFAKPKYYCEVRRWKKGNYTLVTDDDKENKQKALDLMVFFKSAGWSVECGGNVSYIARDEDSELLTVSPEENCISLVYRDEETLKFTKCVNSKVNNLNEEKCFYEISVVYYE